MVPESTLARAQAGDEQAFSDLVAGHLRELHLHCYRILGSVLRDSSRRPQRQPPRPPFNTPEPSREGEPVWLEPIPDDLLDGVADWARELIRLTW